MKLKCLFSILFIFSVFIYVHPDEVEPLFIGNYCNHNPNPLPLPLTDLPGFQLKQTISLIRHGDRTSVYYKGGTQCWKEHPVPVWDCGTFELLVDPNNGTDPANFIKKVENKCLPGQLTNKGRSQLHLIGEKLRELYIHKVELLEEDLAHNSPSDIYVRADSFCQRCFDSAAELVSGLYPPPHRKPQASLVKLNVLADKDVFDTFSVEKICPKQMRYRQDYYQSSDYLDFKAKEEDPLRKLLEQQLNISSIPEPRLMMDCLLAHSCHGFPIPSNLTLAVYEKLFAIKTKEFSRQLSYPSVKENAQVGAGFLLNEMYEQMIFNSAHNPEKYPKFALFAGHDSSLFAVLIALDIYDQGWPPLASLLGFEFYESVSALNISKKYVRIYYNGKVMQPSYCAPPSKKHESYFFDQFRPKETMQETIGMKEEAEIRKRIISKGLCEWSLFENHLLQILNQRKDPKNCE